MQRACLVRVLKWEPRTSVPSFSLSPHCRKGLSHLASVFASICLSCTQHDICHLHFMCFVTVLIRQELEVHTLESIWIFECESGGKRLLSKGQLSPLCPSPPQGMRLCTLRCSPSLGPFSFEFMLPMATVRFLKPTLHSAPQCCIEKH